MKDITLPKELRNLPHPWGFTEPRKRRQQVSSLSVDFNSIKTALNVLERSLHSLTQLTLVDTNCIPEDMITYWGFTAEWLALSIPTLDELSLVKVEQFFINEQGIDSPSPELIFDVAEYWIWWVTKDIEEEVLNWVEDALMATREPILISRFLLIASRYWHKIKPRLGMSLLSASAMIGRQKALPLLEVVEQTPEAPELLKETARDYREFVLDNPEKWLPEAEEQEELAQSKRVVTRHASVATQPAFGQLAWGTIN